MKKQTVGFALKPKRKLIIKISFAI